MNFDYTNEEVSFYEEDDSVHDEDIFMVWRTSEGLCLAINPKYKLVNFDDVCYKIIKGE